MKTKIKKVQVLIFIVLACLGCHNSNDTSKLDKFLENNIIENHIPGLSVSIIKGDSIIYKKALGYASLESKLPMTTERIINVASVSKTITATAIMQLWERGLIDLNIDINNYLPFTVINPYYPETPINIQQLLTHTSSIFDSSIYQNSYVCGDATIQLNDWIAKYFNIELNKEKENDNFLEIEPGTVYNYSNIGYGLLAYIVEIITKSQFDEYCKKNIFSPLEMTDTGWFIDQVNIKNHSTPYLYISKNNSNSIPEEFKKLLQNEKVLVNNNNPLCLYGFPNYPDGLLRTSVSDLSNFVIAMLNEGIYSGKQILKKETIKKMLSKQTIADDKQGVCWRYTGMENIWGHGGDDPGVQTGIYFNPKLKIGMVCIKNSNEGSRTKILKELYFMGKKL